MAKLVGSGQGWKVELQDVEAAIEAAQLIDDQASGVGTTSRTCHTTVTSGCSVTDHPPE